MKAFTLFLFLLVFGLNCSAQIFQLHIIGSSVSENKVIDSLGSNSAHTNAKSVSDAISAMSEKLSKIGFIENQVLEYRKENDSVYLAKFKLGEKIKSIHIYIGRRILPKGEEDEKLPDYNKDFIKDLIGLKKTEDTLFLPYSEVESFLDKTLKQLEQRGFSLATLNLINIQKQKQTLVAELQFTPNQQRQLNEIVLKYAESNSKNSFPKGHLIQMNRKYRNKTFNQEIVGKIRDDFDKFRFTNQLKHPEILFTTDSTKVYVYLEKRKSNTFDGFIGFSNNEGNKLTFNGYLDLNLENTLHLGEQFSLNWKSDGNNQKTFKAGIEIPYLFKSPIGLKAQINIFKQDSTFQNTQTAIDLGYFINYNSRMYLGYQATESSDIQNTNNTRISDYTNSFVTANFEHHKFDDIKPIFLKKTSLRMSIGTGKRTKNSLLETSGINQQFYWNINALHHFELNKNNSIKLTLQNYYLRSDTYIINELYRFGGINSIRGFAENSLQAHFVTAILSEYSYLLSPDLYLHSILDYAYYQDGSTNLKDTLLGIGFGMGLQTKNGLLKLAIANGSSKNQAIKFNNTILQIAYNVKF